MNFNKFIALVIEVESNSKKSWADYAENEGLPVLPTNWKTPNKIKRGINNAPLGIKRT